MRPKDESSFYLKAPDDTEIFVRNWLPSVEVKSRAVIQIVHGMAEHSARYKNFARAMNQQGILVYASDLRGHGKTEMIPQNKGHFADDGGWELVLNDLLRTTRYIQNKHPNLPVILLGHSMGSFLVRRYIQLYGSEINGVIISGTGGKLGIQGHVGRMIVHTFIRLHGIRYRSPMINQLIFGKYNQSFKPNRTPYDWLSRDKHEVDQYIQDEGCGFMCTIGFVGDMIAGISQLYKRKNVKNIPKDLPIFIFSGEMDPLGKNGKASIQSYEQYKKLGMQYLKCKLYEEGRHEMLNEINREEVYRDIMEWVKSIM